MPTTAGEILMAFVDLVGVPAAEIDCRDIAAKQRQLRLT
jgi:hypothetical protein